MGCGSGQREISAPIRLRTVTGRLKITITNAVIFHEVSSFKMDPYAIVKVSNQSFTSKIVEKGDKNPSFNETFSFFINSCFMTHGRNLQITLMDKKKVGSDGQIGYGIVDLDPIINFKKLKDEFRCFLNYDRKQAGLVNVIAQFQQQTSQTLNFRFQTASIRRKTSTFGDMNCWVKVIMGQQQSESSRQKDTKQAPPVWAKQIYTFNVPKSLQKCLIKVMDDANEIGSLQMQVGPLLSNNSEQKFNQEITFNGQVNAGSLKFQTLVGTNPVFSEIKEVHKKIKQEPKKEEKKEEGKKQEKKEDNKKQQPKKEQPKKEQPKKEEPKKEEPKKEEPKKEEPKKP